MRMDRRIETEARAALGALFPVGTVRTLTANGGKVGIVLDPAGGDLPQDARQLARAAVAAIAGVTDVSVMLTQPVAEPPSFDQPRPIEGVGAIVAIASGKGGVGKSTVTANLALALSDMGLRVGVLDADIYGPSQPTMLGATGRPIGRNDKIVPLAAHGLRCMSVGMLMPPGQALIWRGPLLIGVMRQLLQDVIWAPLDVLLVDLPPGTGDVPIALMQTVCFGRQF